MVAQCAPRGVLALEHAIAEARCAGGHPAGAYAGGRLERASVPHRK